MRPDPAWLERLSRITGPALVIAGGPQSSVPPDRVAELARRIPGARLETIPAGHLIHAAEPEAFTETALTFLRPGKAPAACADQKPQVGHRPVQRTARETTTPVTVSREQGAGDEAPP